MTWDKSEFFEAMADEGFLTKVVVESGMSAGEFFMADYRKPAQGVFDGTAQMTEHSIRYQFADVILHRNDEISIAGNRFKLSQPKPTGDGTTYCVASLEPVK